MSTHTPSLSLTASTVAGAFSVVRYLYAHLAEPDVHPGSDYAQTVRLVLRNAIEAIYAAAPESPESWSAQVVVAATSPIRSFPRNSVPVHPTRVVVSTSPVLMCVRDGDAEGVLAVVQYLLDLRMDVVGLQQTPYSATLEALTGDLLQAVERHTRGAAQAASAPR